MEKSCTQCTTQSKVIKRSRASLFSSLLIVIIPKCPFCVMAYSSAITMCGGKSIYLSQNNWISYLPLVLSALILFVLIRNYRDARTLIALGFALLGIASLSLVHQLVIPAIFYNIGAGLLIFSIWLNGSLLSFVSSLKEKIKGHRVLWRA